MSGVQAISFDEIQCGKKIAETKKRFKWRFKINSTSYVIQLINSTLSGKKVVLLNNQQIYNQKNLLNYDFDFTHQLDGHLFRITRVPDNLNKFQLRIDNRDFEQIKSKMEWRSEKTEKKVESTNDPFSQFSSFVSKTKKIQTKGSNDFGDFDFDSFSSNPPANKNTTKPNVAPPASSKAPTANEYQTVNFQTNAFQTNNVSNFAVNFMKQDQDLLSEDAFATNTFQNNNMYLDLMGGKPQARSEAWNEENQGKQPQNAKFKIDMSAKQAMNKVKIAAQQIKMKVKDFTQSLI